MSHPLSFAQLLDYVHSLDVKVCSPKASWDQFIGVEHLWGKVDLILTPEPEKAYALQAAQGVIRWYRLRMTQRIRDDAWRWSEKYVNVQTTVGVLADSDEEFLAAISIHIALEGTYITHEEARHE